MDIESPDFLNEQQPPTFFLENSPEKSVNESTTSNKTSDILSFGKYKGYTLDDLLKKDPEYFRWFAGYTGYRKGNSRIPATSSYTWMSFNSKDTSFLMHQKAKEMIKEKGLCLLCFVPDYDIYYTSWKYWCEDCYYSAKK